LQLEILRYFLLRVIWICLSWHWERTGMCYQLARHKELIPLKYG